MALLASANLDSLKSKEFRGTVLAAIDRAGLWLIYSVAILSVGLMGAFGSLSADDAIYALSACLAGATGVKIALSKKGKDATQSN